MEFTEGLGDRFAVGHDGGSLNLGSLPPFYFATSTQRVSRMTVILICPGY